MRKPFVAGNWKMYKTGAEAKDLITELLPGLNAVHSIDRVVCPTFTSLLPVREQLKGSEVKLGAQNMYWKEAGAFTGEISPAMLAEICEYVILGHSERRAYFGETDEGVNQKVKAAFSFGLKPIVCVGETLTENEAGQTQAVVTRQILNGLEGVEFADPADLVIAYEPVWAIGTGKAATPDGANAVIADYIRPALSKLFGEKTAQAVRVLYGGSVNGANAAEFFQMPDIDGALVGGASLKADFIQIAQKAQAS
jgi:triosephosphate isomerase